MRPLHSYGLKLSFLFALFATVFSFQAAAQQWDIIRAEYGYGSQRVDVTQRLRDIAKSNNTFRMGNSTFGIDPSPGNVKTLFIFARRGNQKRTFEYREGSTVDGALFNGWSGGGWGPPPPPGPGPGADQGYWQILGARYGTPRSNVDVTQRLRELASRNAVFRMGNSTFGVDPDKGVVKTLRIYTRGKRGENRIFEFREGSTVDGSQFNGWGGGGWGRDAWTGGWEGGSGWRVY